MTMRAMRVDPMASDRFPQDVQELQAYLAGDSLVAGVEAVPGSGTDVPLYILGSSLFGAHLAAKLGLPYGFASHFAPGALLQAVELYRERFEPSDYCYEPYVLAGVNVIVDDTDEDGEAQRLDVTRRRVARFLRVPRELTDDEADELLASPQGQGIAQMTHYTAAGSPELVRRYLENFAKEADVDELITVHPSRTVEQRLHSLDLLADVFDHPSG